MHFGEIHAFWRNSRIFQKFTSFEIHALWRNSCFFHPFWRKTRFFGEIQAFLEKFPLFGEIHVF